MLGQDEEVRIEEVENFLNVIIMYVYRSNMHKLAVGIIFLLKWKLAFCVPLY